MKGWRMPCRGDGGLTLVEITVVAAVMSILICASLAALSAGTDVYGGDMACGGIESGADSLFRALDEDLRQSRVVGVGSFASGRDHSALALQAPVDWDGDGDSLSAANDVEWGCRVGRVVHRGGYVVYVFQPERVELEAAAGIDFNGDGDLGDRFCFGSIVRIERSAGGTELERGTVASRVMLRDAAPASGSWPARDCGVGSDGPAAADPLFKLVAPGTPEDGTDEDVAGTVVTVNVWFCQADASHRAWRLHRRDRVALRNPSGAEPPPVPVLTP